MYLLVGDLVILYEYCWVGVVEVVFVLFLVGCD